MSKKDQDQNKPESQQEETAEEAVHADFALLRPRVYQSFCVPVPQNARTVW